MWRRTEARHLRATVVVATVAMIAGLELGAVFRPKMATATIVRPKMATVGSAWTRSRRFAALFNPNSFYDSSGKNQNQPVNSQEDGELFLIPAGKVSSPRMQRSDSKKSFRSGLRGEIDGSESGGGRMNPFDRRYHRAMTSYPDYVAPEWPPRRPLGNLPSLSFGSRTPWKESSSPGKRSPNYYFAASKRQPPPGFHAIRGKRRSDYYENETESETQNETETDDDASSVRQLLDDLQDIS